jgi:hypothetical protein
LEWVGLLTEGEIAGRRGCKGYAKDAKGIPKAGIYEK